jgi:hypothetical protein
MSRRRTPLLAALVAVTAAFVVPTVLAATPNHVLPTQRIDARVLLISADGSEPGFGAWKAELAREGVPYDAFVAYTGPNAATKNTLTDGMLADYGANRAKYDAVILSTGDLGHSVAAPGGGTSFLSALTDAEWSSLARFERTFGIRQISDYTFPSPAHGLNSVAGGAKQDGSVATLTAAGKAAFPYLKSQVPIADDSPTVDEAFGYQSTPTSAANFQTLLTGPNNSSYLGIYTHPDDGREEMVMTVASNENQIHAQLLRHGMVNWATRGVFLGYQRNYLELQVDDLFLGDDVWDPTTHTTNYAANARMSPTDVANAATWSKTNGIRLDFAFNGGGVALNGGASDQLLPAIKANKDAFGFINHTWDHPNLDCSSTNYIGSEIAQNITWAQQQGIPITPTEVVTGEHSGLANTRPGNPGTIDPPFFDEAPTVSATGGTLAAGTYDYALSAQSAAGETTVSISPNVVTTGATSSVTATLTAVCHAVKYNLYRSPAGANTWSLVGSATRLANDPTDNGTAPLEVTITDTGAAGAPATLPTTNGASIAPYSQNPNYLAGVLGAGARYVASDASKTYPTDPLNVGGPQYTVGATFTETGAGGSFQAVPRYPNNVYYNVATRTQQLDEYNWIYLPPPNGICQNSSVNTCRSAPATWAQYVASENSIMFRHIMGNDPRPHFMHQTNLIGGADGGVLYGVIDPLLASYNTYFDRAGTSLVQLTTSQIAQTLARQDAWAANLAAGKITAWIQDGELHVKNTSTGAVDVPLTGTTVGDLYGGQRSGWTTIAAGAERVFTPSDPANVTAPNVSGTARAGSTLRTTKGSWSGTSPIDYSYQWQRCTSQGKSCVNIAGATSDSYDVTSTDTGNRLRAVVSAGNWISSVSQAASDVTAVVGSAPPQEQGSGGQQGSGQTPAAGNKGAASTAKSSKAVKLSLTKLTMSPRRFAVVHKSKPRGTRLDGSRITWRLSKKATVKLSFQRLTGSKKHRRWVTVGTIKRNAKQGTGVVRFRGRFGKKLLKPNSYRVVATATSGRERSARKQVTFKVVKG